MKWYQPFYHLLCHLQSQDLSPTSVFRVYNSSGELGDPTSPYLQHKSPDIFTWASSQQVQHDHGYCQGDSPGLPPSSPSPSDPPLITTIDHGTVVVANIQWYVCVLSLPTSIHPSPRSPLLTGSFRLQEHDVCGSFITHYRVSNT